MGNRHWFEEHSMEEVWCLICMNPIEIKACHNHMKNHYKLIVCNICGKTIKGAQSKLKDHMRNQHKIGEKLKVICSHCGKVFSSPEGMKAHVENAHMDYVWKCKICGKEFNNVNTAKG